jgi:extracellular matrix regulatory protein A
MVTGLHTVNIGFGNRVIASRIVAVLIPGSSPLRRLKEEAKHLGKLGNATQGRKCRSILLLDSGHVILSAVHPDTVCQRLETVACGNENDGNRAVLSRIVAVFAHGSSSMNRLKTEARSAGRLVDLTHGRKCRSIVVMDTGQTLLSAVHPDTLEKRLSTTSGETEFLKKET